MSTFILFLYRLLRNHKIILYITIIAIIAVSAFAITKIKFEEDISKTISDKDNISNLVLKHSKITDKLIVNISLSDKSKLNSELLIEFANELVDSLQSGIYIKYLNADRLKIDENYFQKTIDVIYSNLPIFLNEEDYYKIDSIIERKNIHKAIENTYKSLISPVGFATKKYLVRDPLGISSLAYSKLKQLQTDDNYELYDGYIFANNKKNLLLFLESSFSSSMTSENSELLLRLNQLAQKLAEKYDDLVSIEVFGAPAVAAGNANQLKRDITLTITIAIILILLFLAWYFKKAIIPLICLLPALFGGTVGLAIIYLMRGEISIIALAIGSVLLGIIVDFSIYILNLYKNKPSLEQVFKKISLSIILCSITSATAFFSLFFVKSLVLKDLGLFAGLSILLAAGFSLVVFPHIIDSLKLNNISNSRKSIINQISSYQYEKSTILIVLLTSITVFFLFFFNKANFETDMYKMNYMSTKMCKAENNLKNITDLKYKSIYLVAYDNSLNNAHKNLNDVENTLKQLKDQEIIKSYSFPSSIVITDSLQKKRISMWNKYWNQNKKEVLLSNLMDAEKKFGFSNEAFLDFKNLIKKKYTLVDKKIFSETFGFMIDDMIVEKNGKSMLISILKVEDENRELVFKDFDDLTNIVVFDKQQITDNFVANIKNDFNLLVKLCLVFVTIVLIVAYGRIELGLIASAPMFVSWLITIGIMGIFGLKFNIFNIIIATFVFGLGVDYTILMMRALVLKFKYGQNDISSYKSSVFLSSFTTIIGMGVLFFAKHPALKSMALISVIGVVSVLIVTYTLEPFLFNILITKRNKKRKLPVTAVDLLFTLLAFSLLLFFCILLNLLFPFIRVMPVKKVHKQKLLRYLIMVTFRMVVYVMVHIKKTIKNHYNEDFKKPAMIIANHQSHIDLLIMMMLSPKTIIMTADWVWNNPLYRFIIRYLNFYPASMGYEHLIEKLKSKVDEGYSIMVFPEGTRSKDSKIKRFHKGAFLMAEALHLDILPIMLHGFSDCMNKGEDYLKKGSITVEIHQRIQYGSKDYGKDYHERTKSTLKFFRSEYEKIKRSIHTPDYFKDRLIKNYIYKGPVLEWYVRIKLRLEENYKLINNLVSLNAKVTDIGCGYGYLSYMLSFVSNAREITGIDFDKEKVDLASNCISKTPNLKFVCSDALNYSYTQSDVFILSDVLHYLSPKKQEQLIATCIQNLTSTGIIIIRDADKELVRKHRRTKISEFFSTRFGFNKMSEKELSYTSASNIKQIVKKYALDLEIIDTSRTNSNRLFIIRKNKD